MPNIPLGDVLEGIRRCHENARALLDAAENAHSGAHPAYALALYSFALEELGKAALLRDAAAVAELSARFAAIPDGRRDWRDHRVKLNAAIQELGDRALQIDPFQREAFQTDAFQSVPDARARPADDLYANFEARLASLYVDYSEGRWTQAPTIVADKLAARIAELRTYLDDPRK